MVTTEVVTDTAEAGPESSKLAAIAMAAALPRNHDLIIGFLLMVELSVPKISVALRVIGHESVVRGIVRLRRSRCRLKHGRETRGPHQTRFVRRGPTT